MSDMTQHPDRHGCGGLWVGGVCTECRAVCQCELCCTTWDEVCEELVLACEQLPLDTAPEPDDIYNRFVGKLKMATAQYKLARGKLPYPTGKPCPVCGSATHGGCREMQALHKEKT